MPHNHTKTMISENLINHKNDSVNHSAADIAC